LLASYYYVRKWNPDKMGKVIRDKGIEWMLDSGAYSAKTLGEEIPLDEYIEFVKRHEQYLSGGYVTLDAIGSPSESKRNLETMLDAGLHPLPVHVFGDTGERMDELFELSDLVCLGGLKRPGRGPAPKQYVLQKMEWANGRAVHWLGYTTQSHMTALRPYSVDSSSWQSPVMYGGCYVYQGGGHFQRFGIGGWVDSVHDGSSQAVWDEILSRGDAPGRWNQGGRNNREVERWIAL